MSILTRAFIMSAFAFGVLLGYIAGRMEWEHNDCYDATGKYQRYEAWLSVKNGTYRCFWVETQSPFRVKMQGVIDVK